jgi:hypothetical protein
MLEAHEKRPSTLPPSSLRRARRRGGGNMGMHLQQPSPASRKSGTNLLAIFGYDTSLQIRILPYFLPCFLSCFLSGWKGRKGENEEGE